MDIKNIEKKITRKMKLMITNHQLSKFKSL